jgi:hypothetical protein
MNAADPKSNENMTMRYVFTQCFDAHKLQKLIENRVSACGQLCPFDPRVLQRDFAIAVEAIL